MLGNNFLTLSTLDSTLFVTPFIGFTCYLPHGGGPCGDAQVVQGDKMMADPYGRVAKPTRGIVVLKVLKEPQEGKRGGLSPDKPHTAS